ncbi:hypothetical protein Taro_005779, partial [Colocasia esculenta]|nr:hypothetical protein [Colocasia esculenta]
MPVTHCDLSCGCRQWCSSLESRVRREHPNTDHMPVTRCDLSCGCRQVHYGCRQVLLETGFQNYVGHWNPGLSTGDLVLPTGKPYLST